MRFYHYLIVAIVLLLSSCTIHPMGGYKGDYASDHAVGASQQAPGGKTTDAIVRKVGQPGVKAYTDYTNLIKMHSTRPGANKSSKIMATLNFDTSFENWMRMYSQNPAQAISIINEMTNYRKFDSDFSKDTNAITIYGNYIMRFVNPLSADFALNEPPPPLMRSQKTSIAKKKPAKNVIDPNKVVGGPPPAQQSKGTVAAAPKVNYVPTSEFTAKMEEIDGGMERLNTNQENLKSNLNTLRGKVDIVEGRMERINDRVIEVEKKNDSQDKQLEVIYREMNLVPPTDNSGAQSGSIPLEKMPDEIQIIKDPKLNGENVYESKTGVRKPKSVILPLDDKTKA